MAAGLGVGLRTRGFAGGGWRTLRCGRRGPSRPARWSPGGCMRWSRRAGGCPRRCERLVSLFLFAVNAQRVKLIASEQKGM